MAIIAQARKISRLATQLGSVNGMLYLLNQALARLSGGRAGLYKYYFVAQPIVAGKPLPASASAAIQLTAHDDPIVAIFSRPAAIIRERFARGAQCLTATVKGRFAGFLWLAHNFYLEDEVRGRYVLADPARQVWDYDVYVEPEFRLGRTFARLWQAANQRLAADGIEWSLSRISAFNPDSLASHRRLGIQHLASRIFWVVGDYQFSLVTRAPYLHFSNGPQRVPEILLHAPTKYRAS